MKERKSFYMYRWVYNRKQTYCNIISCTYLEKGIVLADTIFKKKIDLQMYNYKEHSIALNSSMRYYYFFDFEIIADE